MIDRMYRLGKSTILLLLAITMGICAIVAVYLVYCTGYTLFYDDAVTYTFRIHQIEGRGIATILVFFVAVCLTFMVDHSYSVKS